MVRAAAMVAAVVVGVSLGAVGVAGGAGDRGGTGGGPPGGPVATSAADHAPDLGASGPATPAPDGAAPARTFTLPLDAPVVVARPFDGPPQPWAAGHRGVDLAAHLGQAVRAPQAGVVTFAGTVVDRGVVTVTHDDGLRSSLEPVTASVTVGQRVVRGQVIGAVSAAPGHCAPATCLHWGLRRGEAYLDPMRWVLDRGPVVLLPRG